ncbi:MAG: hypothetical protein NTW87_16015 [Planctomycetota bacterium]|nr:hypothetical protein [Planctomycetota bacterium]
MLLQRPYLLLLGLCMMPALLERQLAAGEEKPYRQFPEMPEVLFYEGFEGAAPTWKPGKVDADTVPIPGTHSWKLGEAEWGKNDKWMTALVELPLNIPGGVDPSQVHVFFQIWCDETGELVVKFKNGDFEEKKTIAKYKMWCPISLALTEAMKDRKHPAKDSAIRQIEIDVKPRDKNKPCTVYVDDILVTVGVRPADILPRVLAMGAKAAAATRTVEKDSFSCSPQSIDILQGILKGLKGKKKPRTVVVAGARGNDTQDLIKGLVANGAKVKAAGFNFIPCAGPDNSSAVGLDGMRAFLPYCLQKNDAEMVLLMLASEDANKPGRTGEGVRAVLERALEAGCVPIVCLPPNNDKGKPEAFHNTVANLCIQMGLPWVDSAACIKAAKDALDGGKELNAVGVEALSAVAIQAVKHMDANFFGRK